MVRKRTSMLVFAVTLALACAPMAGQKMAKSAEHAGGEAVLWTDPGDIRSRNLFFGPGGKKNVPQPPVTFEKEDEKGTSPKFDVRDQADKKWKAKLGVEAQPETVAVRLLWAVGYDANENYFFPDLQVDGLPKHLQRGEEVITAGHARNVRLQRHPHGDKKAGEWSWRKNPFKGTREFNGLRVMMALISNWDLKDSNNAIYEDGAGHKLYQVSDVGGSFGRSGKSYNDVMSKNNLGAYQRAKFVSKVRPDYVDFNFPTRPPFLYIFHLPFFIQRMRIHWIGKHIPRDDARWVGSLLKHLSPQQIRDAFRAAGYSPEQTEAFATALEHRIAELAQL